MLESFGESNETYEYSPQKILPTHTNTLLQAVSGVLQTT